MTTQAITTDKTRTGCPATDNGYHFIESVIRPAYSYNGVQQSGPERRGICAFCGELFVEEA